MGGSSKNSTADGRADLEGGKHASPSKKASFEAREARHYRANAAREAIVRVASSGDDKPIKDRQEARRIALEFRRRHMPRIPTKNLPGYRGRVDQRYPLSTPIFKKDRPSLADLGIGISLYFETVRLLSFIFLAMFIICLPSIVVAFLVQPPDGDSAKVGQSEGAMAQMSFATVAGIFRKDGGVYGCGDRVCVLRDGSEVDARYVAEVIVYCDLACCLALLLCVPLIRRLFRRYAEAVDEGNITAGDYSIMVWGLPRVVTGMQVKAHFDRLLDRSFGSKPGKGSKIAGAAACDVEAGGGGDANAGRVEGDSGSLKGVSEVFLARADCRVLTKFKKRGALIRERVNCEAGLMAKDVTESERRKIDGKIAKVTRRIEALDQDIDGFDKTGRLNPVVCAFVIFNSQASKIDVLTKYVKKGGNGAYFGLIPPHQECLFEGKRRIIVSQAPEPSNIIWENLEATLAERSLRKLLSSLATILIVLFSFFLIVWGKSVNQTMMENKGSCSDPLFAAGCNANLNWQAKSPHGCPAGQAECTLGAAWGVDGIEDGMVGVTPLSVDTSSKWDKVPVLLSGSECRKDHVQGGFFQPLNLTRDCWEASIVTAEQWRGFSNVLFNEGFANASSCTDCFCWSLQTSSPSVWDASWDFMGISASIRSSATGKAVCDDQAGSYRMFVYLQCAAVVIIVVLNVAVQVCTMMLAFFERHHTLQDHERSIALSVFLGQFVNTALVALLVYARIDALQISIADSLGSLSAWFPLLSGTFKDFTEKWYSVVGVQIMTTVLINITAPLYHLFISWTYLHLLLPRLSNYAVTQSEMNSMYAGSTFILSERYGHVLNTVFTCLMYSSGMPIMLLFGSVILIFSYWCDKRHLLTYAAAPPQFSEKLAFWTLDLVKYAVLLHLLVGCWVFSAARSTGGGHLFPRPPLNSVLENYTAVLLDASWGCSTLEPASECESVEGCSWSNWGGADATESCFVNTTDTSYGDFTAAELSSRLINAVTFPYVVVTALVCAFELFTWTPVYALLVVLAKKGYADLKLRMHKGKVGLEREGDHHICSYAMSVQTNRFGSFPKDYDLSRIGRYEEVLSLGDNREVFRKINVHVPLGVQNARAFADRQKQFQQMAKQGSQGKSDLVDSKKILKGLRGSFRASQKDMRLQIGESVELNDDEPLNEVEAQRRRSVIKQNIQAKFGSVNAGRVTDALF